MDEILPVYKPSGITSYDVIRAYKRAQFTGMNPVKYKVGHGGTLDPFADGVLLLLLGKATKRMNELSALPKTYRATAVLGVKSDTLDRMGKVDSRFKIQDLRMISREQIEDAAQKFVGTYEQEIPAYSAAKVNGQPRYKLARKGQDLKKKTKPVTIYSLNMLHYDDLNHGSTVSFEATVSSGTYIRQLSYDIFKTLGIESYLDSLTRTAIGEFTLKKCSRIEDFGTLAHGE